jgi:hypothetical protein
LFLVCLYLHSATQLCSLLELDGGEWREIRCQQIFRATTTKTASEEQTCETSRTKGTTTLYIYIYLSFLVSSFVCSTRLPSSI